MESNTEFIDWYNVLGQAYGDEYRRGELIGWHLFIQRKDLGITYIDIGDQWQKIYDIHDHKKWMLTRIKYGI